MFKPLPSRLNLPFQEEQILNYWRLHRIFEKASQQRQGQPEYVFYEGPPTANGKPGVHHALARAFKDIFPRYQMMRGRHVVRRGGWDTHGLPVEIGVEKQLGFTSKAQIEAYGIAKFNQLCRKSAFEFIKEWERFTDRLGFWVDLSDAYVTYTNEYIESVWWILKAFWDKDLLYQGFKVVPYCPRCGTPLSDHEVALGYSDATDPSVYVRFPLVDELDGVSGVSLLVWTTTPWTLPGNVAVAVHPEVEYVTVERVMEEGGRERLILARPLVEKVFGEERVKIIDSYPGKKLKGKRYKPLFTFLHPDKPAHYVVLQDYVTVEDGTGLVHTAPAFGAEDMQAAHEFDLPILLTVGEDGAFIPEVRPWSGKFVKDADPFIIEDLQTRGLLFKAGTITHTYPFCWRCDTPLLYYARNTWYIRTSQHKERLSALNQQINWAPGHIKNGRFGNWLDNNIDWALGRERYWGTPLPVWECETCRHQLAVGSIAELSELAGRDLSKVDLHRPYVDQIKFPCPECQSTMRRVPELIDVWFDSGAMPYAQWHFPFENRDHFRQQYPADFICEAVDQTRGWFYSLHAISALLNDSVAFKNVICLGLILDADGQKMSKSRGNVADPWEVLNIHGADAFRWYLYTASHPGQERRFSVDLVGEVVRNFILPLWNVYAFFVTNANLDGWTPAVTEQPALTPQPPLPKGEGETGLPSPSKRSDGGGAGGEGGLDRWLLSELHTLVRQVTQALEEYNVTAATRPVQAFVEDLSKWYLRRSRKRFWKNASAEDKQSAYNTLYETLVTLSKLIAPTMPFLAETLYQNLVRTVDGAAPASVHLCDWPTWDEAALAPELAEDMQAIMKLASLGHAARIQAEIKVRQPLAEAAFSVSNVAEMRALERFADLLADELNVKTVRLLGSKGEAIAYSLKPLPKQLGQKYKSLFPKVSQAILALDAAQAASVLLAGRPVQVQVGGETLDIQPDEVEVRTEARSGLAVAAEGAYLAALKTELTPALVREGLAREVVRRVQDLRKQAELDIAERIPLYLNATPDLLAVILEYQETILSETLISELIQSEPPAGAVSADAWFNGHWMKITVAPVSKTDA